MKLRLIFRTGEADAEGRFVGFCYSTVIVEIPDKALTNNSGHVILPEVIGGEWLKEEK